MGPDAPVAYINMSHVSGGFFATEKFETADFGGFGGSGLIKVQTVIELHCLHCLPANVFRLMAMQMLKASRRRGLS